MGRLLLNYVLSDPYVGVALVGMRGPRPRGTRFVELNNENSDDVASRMDLAKLHDRYVRQADVGVLAWQNLLGCTFSQLGGQLVGFITRRTIPA